MSVAIGADKSDVFLYKAASNSLVALGTSDTPLGHRQRELGAGWIGLVTHRRGKPSNRVGSTRARTTARSAPDRSLRALGF